MASSLRSIIFTSQQRQRYARDPSSYHESIPFRPMASLIIHVCIHHHHPSHLSLASSQPHQTQSHQHPPTTPKIPKTVKTPAPARSAVVISLAVKPPGAIVGLFPAPALPFDVPPESAVTGVSAGVMRFAPMMERAHICSMLIPHSHSSNKHHLISPVGPPHCSHPTFSSTTADHTSSRLSHHYTAPLRRSRSPVVSA
jgi:hypothetical protein